MPDLSMLLVFASACLVLTATPGPDMLLVASRSLSQGRAAGLLTYAGIAAGSYCHAIAAALGLSQLLIAVPAAYEAIRWAGAAYLLYLAWKAIRATPAAFALDPSAGRRPLARIFVDGFLTNLLNPKVALFVLALFPQFVRPEAGSILVQMLVLSTILNGMGLVVNGAVILLSGHLGWRLAGAGRYRRLPQYLLATVFAALAGRLLLGGRD